MKKTIISIATAAVCASALSVTAFAEDILTDKSIYLQNREELAKSVESWVIDGRAILPDPNTIMPVYEASIYDYAKNGTFKIEPEGHMYFSDAMDEDGNYAGRLQLTLKNGTLRSDVFLPSNDISDSIAFEANARRVNALMTKRGLNTDCKEVKLVLFDGAGFAYYIDNGTEKMLVAANINAVNDRIFNDKNGGIVVIGDELMAAAKTELAEYEKYLEEYQKILDTLDPNDPLPAGDGYETETPKFMVDNTPYLDSAENNVPSSDNEKNPDTGHGAGAALGAAALLSLTAGAVVVSKKRKGN